jgi:hypothetical protein
MNKRIEKEFGEHVAEKRGWHWALTSFVVEVWGETFADCLLTSLYTRSLIHRLQVSFSCFFATNRLT